MSYTYTGQPFTLANDPPKAKKQKPAKREKAESKEWKNKCKRALYTPPTASNDELLFRHSNWATKRALVLAALKSCGTSATALDSFENCGAECVVEYCNEEKKYKLRATYCHCRHCEPCNRAKANLLAANLRKRLEEKADGRYRFITLTLKHKDIPLREQIDNLYAGFRRLRGMKLWKTSQIGGCAILETKWDADTGLWHPHLHIISEGDYMAQSDLSNAWHDATGDSHIVDIRSLQSGKDAAHYVAKYVSKGTNNEVWHNANASQEWIISMKGTRTAATYGRWRGFKLLEQPESKGVWVKIGTLNSIYRDARDGHTYAVKLLEAITRDLQYDPHKKRTKTPNT